MALRLCRMADHRPPPLRRVVGVGSVAGAVPTRMAVMVGYPFARARGSSQNVAKSQSSTAMSTASVTSRKSACSKG